MDNYLCINSNKTELTAEQLQKLGITPQRGLAEICEIVRSGKARDVYKVHDTIKAGGYTLEIIGFNHDLARGRYQRGENRLTMTVMAKELLPAHRMHGGSCKRGWVESEMREWLNADFIKKLPDELAEHIAPVFKQTHGPDGKLYETRDHLWLPSESELFGSAIYSDYEDGPRYEAFATSNDRIRVDEDGDGYPYWSRSFYSGSSTYCALVYISGGAYYNAASNASIRAPLCFCLA